MQRFWSPIRSNFCKQMRRITNPTRYLPSCNCLDRIFVFVDLQFTNMPPGVLTGGRGDRESRSGIHGERRYNNCVYNLESQFEWAIMCDFRISLCLDHRRQFWPETESDFVNSIIPIHWIAWFLNWCSVIIVFFCALIHLCA